MSNENSNKNNKSSKEQEAGALWLKKSKAGASFLSGYVLSENKEKVQVVVFKNSYKKPGDSSPDYRIYFSENKNSDAQKQKANNGIVGRQNEETQDSSIEDEIPF